MFNTTLYKIKTHELSLVRKLSPNGASEENRTPIPALARPCTNHCTTPASQVR